MTGATTDVTDAEMGLLAPSAPAPQRNTSVAPPNEAPASGESALRSALSVLTTLGPPLTIATALMVYFGWARSAAQARYMGLDVSMFGYSTQDYVLRSVNTLYIPILVIVSLALGWFSAHSRVVVALRRPESLPAIRLAGRIALSIGLAVILCVVLTATIDSTFAPLVLPLALAAGTVAAAYGAWLGAAARGPLAGGSLPPWHRALRAFLIGGLITIALFWELSNYAGVVGRGYAVRVGRSVPALPRATVFSATPLGIQATGVQEQVLNAGPDVPKDSLRYRTTGLRFLVRSGGRMFLLHDGWTPEHGTVIVLPDDNQLRWQFAR